MVADRGPERAWLALGALNGGIAVILGAVAAHVLEADLPNERVDWLTTGARYAMVHALALVAVAWVRARWRGWLPVAAGWAFLLGAVLFSGGLYVAALSGWRAVIAVVPVGGVAYIAGWFLLAGTALFSRRI